MSLQSPAFFDVPDKVFQVVCLELVVFLADIVTLIIRSQIARWPRTPYKIVNVAPD